MQTYTALYQDEERALSIKIRDNDECAFDPDEVWTTIEDMDGNIIIARQVAMVDPSASNVFRTVVGPTVTANTGDYYLKWEIIKDTYTYFHRTKLEILPI